MGLKLKKKTAIKSESVPFWERDIDIRGGRLSDKGKRDFYGELEMLLGAGVDVSTAIVIMQEESGQEDDVLAKVSHLLMTGESLSSSLSKQKGFSSYEVSSVRIGEESGNLLGILGHIAKYYSGRIALRAQIQNVLTYPLLVLTLALAITYFMLVEVVPMFQQIYRSFDAVLPEMTQRIIEVSEFVQHWGFAVLVVIGLAVLMVYLSRQRAWFRRLTSSFLLRLPVVGRLVQKIYLARFCQSMRLLISSDVPLSYSLDLVAEMISFYPMELALADIKSRLVGGESFHKSIGRYPRLFEKKFVSLMKVSEDTNRFEEMFARLSEQYQQEVQSSTTAFGKLLEPILIIIIAIFVGFILVAMYMPLFQMGDAVL